jgi:hypothetical protein
MKQRRCCADLQRRDAEGAEDDADEDGAVAVLHGGGRGGKILRFAQDDIGVFAQANIRAFAQNDVSRSLGMTWILSLTRTRRSDERAREL